MQEVKKICYECLIDGKKFYGSTKAREGLVKLRAVQHVIIKHDVKENPERFVRKC